MRSSNMSDPASEPPARPTPHKLNAADRRWIDDAVGYDHVATVGAAYRRLVELRGGVERGHPLVIEGDPDLTIITPEEFDRWVRQRYPGFEDGTTAGLSVLRGYRLHESVEIYKRLRLRAVLTSIARSVVIVPRTAFCCLRQRSRWPWTEFEGYLDVSLRDIRRQFGITVARGTAAPGG